LVPQKFIYVEKGTGRHLLNELKPSKSSLCVFHSSLSAGKNWSNGDDVMRSLKKVAAIPLTCEMNWLNSLKSS
jgi:hypothetical protein